MSAPEFCARCGNFFPDGQVCGRCVTDAETLTAAAALIRRRSRHPERFWVKVITRVLDKWAANLARADRDRGPGAHPAPDGHGSIRCTKCGLRIKRDSLCSDLAVITLHWMSDHREDYLRLHPECAEFI